MKPLQYLRFFLLICFLMILAGMFGMVQAQSEPEAGTIRNPLNPYGGPDPWLTYYEGNYYLATTTGTSDLLMRSAPTLAGLKTAIPVRIYTETDPSRCCNMWAPEFHLLDGPNGLRWYFYYTAGTTGTLDNQRIHVLESAGTDPMGPYTYKARIFDPYNDGWAIDASVMTLNDQLYLLSSSWVGPNQSMFIAAMSDPWTMIGPRALLSQPEYGWEKSGANVNEGPVALQRNGQTFIIYSASYCVTADYKLGMLTYNGGDPLRRDSWIKHPEPVFQRSDENGVFGPGHNGFFLSPDGTENWIVYHANDSAQGVCDDRRTTRVQPFTWNEDGTPNFGTPLALGVEIAAPSGDAGVDTVASFSQLVSSFRSFAYDSAYLRRFDTTARVEVMDQPSLDAMFYVVPGLADPEGISIMSMTLSGYFLRRQGNAVIFSTNDGTQTFAEEVTWYIRPGLADENWISLEAYGQPGYYVGRMFGIMALIQVSDSMPDTARQDATFEIERQP